MLFIQIPIMVALTKPSVLVTKTLKYWQQGTYDPLTDLTYKLAPLKLRIQSSKYFCDRYYWKKTIKKKLRSQAKQQQRSLTKKSLIFSSSQGLIRFTWTSETLQTFVTLPLSLISFSNELETREGSFVNQSSPKVINHIRRKMKSHNFWGTRLKEAT